MNWMAVHCEGVLFHVSGTIRTVCTGISDEVQYLLLVTINSHKNIPPTVPGLSKMFSYCSRDSIHMENNHIMLLNQIKDV